MPARWVLTPSTQAVGGLVVGPVSFQDRYAEAAMKLSPVAHFPMSDTDAVLRDITGRYSGTYTGGTRSQGTLHRSPGKSFLTGTSGTYGSSATLPALSVWTIVFWARPVVTASFNFLFNHGSVAGSLVRIGAGQDNSIRTSEGSGWTSNSGVWANAEVAHIAAVYNGSTCTVYKNGVSTGTVGRINIPLPSVAWVLNTDQGGGYLQDVSFFDYSLTVAQISSLYGTGK